jgi:hypothetical protein
MTFLRAALRVRLSILGSLACLVLFPVRSSGDATVSLSWRSCGEPLRTHEQVAPGGDYYVWMWVTGQPDGIQGYSLGLRISSSDGSPLSDSWRFDELGCQGDAWFGINTSSALPLVCGDMSGGHTISQFGIIEYDATCGCEKINIHNQFLPRENLAPNAKYLLAVFRLFQGKGTIGATTAGSCGGLEQPICVGITEASFELSVGGTRAWGVADQQITAGPDAIPASLCAITSTASSSWGTLKALYRN